MTKLSLRKKHLTVLVVIAIIAAALAAGAVGYAYKNKSNPDAVNKEGIKISQAEQNNLAQSDSNQKQDGTASEGRSSYLVISEWGVRVSLPDSMNGAVTYKLGEAHADPDGNQIQGAKIMLATKILPENQCATFSTPIGQASESGAQFIRSESSKPFNVARYKWTFKENILKTSEYNYHLNYITPDCIGTAVDKMETLQGALINLRQVE